jgi:hypothetical protein
MGEEERGKREEERGKREEGGKEGTVQRLPPVAALVYRRLFSRTSRRVDAHTEIAPSP